MLNAAAALFHQLALAGVNHSIPGNGGADCAQYIPTWQKVAETLVFVPLSFYLIFWSLNSLEYPQRKYEESKERRSNESPDSHNGVPKVAPSAAATSWPTREYVFGVYAGVFVVELVYKVITGTCIFFLNPCHITTALQLALLRMPADHPMTTQLFRFQMFTVPGALIAIVFPILNTRLMIGEVLIYFVQHTFIVLVPLYLISLEGAFVPESAWNVAWPTFSMALIVLYHFLLLQPVAQLTHVNLNCILCPAVSDPFAGRLYRLCAVAHQSLAVPLLTKLYALSAVALSGGANGLARDARKPKLK